VGDRGSLNISDGVGDDPAIVQANWALVRAALPGLAIARSARCMARTSRGRAGTPTSVRLTAS
jgi:hypothetical protein